MSLRLVVLAGALACACIGPSGPRGERGPAGEDGTSCSVENVTTGVRRIVCTDGTTVEVNDGAPGVSPEPCEVEETASGALITCPDGSRATVADGVDGGSCSVATVEGTTTISCTDGTEVVVGSGDVAALVRTVEEPEGEECPGGGTRVETGVDDDRDGVLDDGEVDATAFVCRPEGSVAEPCEVFEGPATLRNTLDLRAFAALGCVRVDGDLVVDGPLTDLSSLGFVQEVTGELQVTNTRATSLPFGVLERVGGGITVNRNEVLAAIEFPVLQSAESLSVVLNPDLVAISMPSLVSLGSVVLEQLESFTGPFAVPSLVTLDGTLTLRDLPALTTLSGPSALRRLVSLELERLPLLAVLRLPGLRRLWAGMLLEDVPVLDQCALDALLWPVSSRGPEFVVLDVDAPRTACVGTRDADGDGVLNAVDNCVLASNASQTDTDANGTGNACQARVPGAGHLRINELLADPPAGAPGDANGDGVRDAQDDEFVELVNTTDQPLLLNGVTLHRKDTGFIAAPYTTDVRFTFPSVTLLPGRAVVVFGGGTPAGTFGDTPVFKAGTQKLSLTATAYLQVAAAGTEVTRLAYNASGADNVPLGANTLGRSINRAPDVTGTSFLAHDSVTGASTLFSPGTKSDGSFF